MKNIIKKLFGRIGNLLLQNNLSFQGMEASLQHHLVDRDFTSLFTYWADPWLAYFASHATSLDQRLNDLIEGMDATSVRLAEHHFHLVKDCLPRVKDFWKILFRNDLVWEDSRHCDWIREVPDVPKAFEIFSRDSKLSAYKDALPRFSISDIYGLKSFPIPVVDQIKDADVIDGGAWLADSSLSFAISGARHVYAFEPNPESADLAEIVAASSGANGRISIVRKGLSDVQTKLTFSRAGSIDQGATFVTGASDSEKTVLSEIPTTTIDDFVRELDLSPKLIKLDVEGFESKAIAGAEQTIRRFRPLIICAVYHSPKDFFEIKPKIASWGLNYRFEIRRLDFVNPMSDVYLLATPL